MNPSSPNRRSRARERSDALYRELRARISTLEYPPLTVLSENQLAAEFGVSRSPIRQVLNRLEADGLVETRHGAGTMVTDIDLAGLEQIYGFRMRLAELAGDLDPAPPGPSDFAAWRALVGDIAMLRDRPDPVAYARINMQFHALLLERVGNPPLREAIDRLFFQTARVWLHNMPDIDWAGEVAIFGREVDMMVRTLELGDMHGVGLVYRNIIASSLYRLFAYRRAAPD